MLVHEFFKHRYHTLFHIINRFENQRPDDGPPVQNAQALFDGRIKTNSTLVTDKMNSYVRFTNANGIALVQLKTGKAKKGTVYYTHLRTL